MTRAPAAGETWLVRALLAAYALFFLWQALALDASSLVNGVLDDSFYYLQVARHMAAGHGSTFDGVEPTNGYHPLWLWLLVPIQRLVADPIASMRAALLLSGALGLTSLVVIGRILTRVGAAAAVPIALLVFAWPRLAKQTTSLLETPLVLLLYLLVFDALLSFDLSRRRARVALGALLGLACLARLDSVFLLAAFAVFAALDGREPKLLGRAQRVFEPLFVAGLFLTPYLIWNLTVFGHLQPISGAMKSSFPQPGLQLEPWRAFPEFVLLLLAGGVFLGVALLRRERWLQVLGLFGMAALLHALYTALFMVWGVDVWHFTLLLPIALLGLPWAFEQALRATFRGRRGLGLARWVVLTVGVAAAFALQTRSLQLREGRHLDVTRGLALWARDSLPADAVFAGTDTGVFAYFSGRTTVNLDGLINNYRYRDALLSGRFREYLDERGVDYIFDQFAVGRPDWIDGTYETRSLRIWDRPRNRVAGEVVLHREDEVRRIRLLSRQTLGSNERAPNAITLWKLRLP